MSFQSGLRSRKDFFNMNGSNFASLIFSTTVLTVIGQLPTRACKSPQYVKLGQVGIIDCDIPENFVTVVWYNSSDYVNNLPILDLHGSRKIGPGYDSGEYDVYPNGSLIINDVQKRHNGSFLVAYLLPQQDWPVFNEIIVIVFDNELTPTQSLPTELCYSPQFLEVGNHGVVACKFQEGFYAVIWYNSSDYVKNAPILDLRSSRKTGMGYHSGEFDVYPNGSLIINNVSIKHDGIFTVAYFPTQQQVPDIIEVRVIVIVKPAISFPYIRSCGNYSNKCYSTVEPPMMCSVEDIIPAVNLTWIARTVEGDKIISNHYSTTYRDNVGYTTEATLRDPFIFSKVLVLLVCQLHSPPGMKLINESTILAQNSAADLNLEQIPTILKLGSTMTLACSNTSVGFLVWKLISPENETHSELLLYSFLTGKHTEHFVDNMTVGIDGSLIVPDIHVGHEGTYMCIFGDGLTDGWTSYKVSVIVEPSSPHAFVEGCDHQEYCSLEVGYKGNLTCMVKGVRPAVQLEWTAFYEQDDNLVSFETLPLAISSNGDTFDVSLTALHNVESWSIDRLTVECKVPEANEIFHITKKVDLFFVKDPEPGFFITYFFLIPYFIGYILWLLWKMRSILPIPKWLGNWRKIYPRKGQSDKDSASFYLLENVESCNIRATFVEQLKQTYHALFENTHPMAHIKHYLHSVDDPFVQGCITFCESTKGLKSNWKCLSTYEEILSNPNTKSTRQLILGPSGYGKSTVSLQIARDWCNQAQTSPLKDVEILILLPLQKVQTTVSIFEAIKTFNLPKDTEINESTIKSILSSCNSVVMIFDGFDQYPGSDNVTTPDIMKIISGEMFQTFHVITTATPSRWPKNIPDNTRLLKLTGFDDKARDDYLQKTVLPENVDFLSFEECLRENSVLLDLCQVPILFVNFVHMVYECEEFKTLNTLTQFFNCVIGNIVCYRGETMGDSNNMSFKKPLESDLDEIAFETLKTGDGRTIGRKDELHRRLGRNLYDVYFRSGIFVEEDSIDIIDDPEKPDTSSAHYTTKVRFHHKLFCEWYAAHYLSERIKQNEYVDLSEFLPHQNPDDMQYLYRFTCGLDTISAEKIIAHLARIEDSVDLVSLCMLEQPQYNLDVTGEACHVFSHGVFISNQDSFLLQRSLVQLINFATQNNVSIKYVALRNCIESVNISDNTVNITSDLSLTNSMTAKKLLVFVDNTELCLGFATDLLHYASQCPSIEYFVFHDCIPPSLFEDESVLSDLLERSITVLWRPSSKHQEYILNLSTGRWKTQKNDKEPTKAEFDKLRVDIVGTAVPNFRRTCVSWCLYIFFALVLGIIFGVSGSVYHVFVLRNVTFISLFLSFFFYLFLCIFLLWLHSLVHSSLKDCFVRN